MVPVKHGAVLSASRCYDFTMLRHLTWCAAAVAAWAAFAGPGPAFAQQRVPPTSRADVQLSFAPLVKKAAPAVVNVFTRKTIAAPRQFSLFDDPFFRRFARHESSLGSGVIVRSDGTVVTNHHVIEGADEIKVVLADRREFAATILGSDAGSDLAVLKIEAHGETFPFLEFHDSDDIEVGDLVLAIGNPFGVGQTVTSGIVSALARTQVGINDLNFFIQTDAAINPGNSGGALISLDGKLIGINTAIYSQSGGSVGIGFAIPSNMVSNVVANLSGGGKMVRPWLGMTGQPVTNDIAQQLGLRFPVGVLVEAVYPNGPADRAGVRPGDVVRAVNGRDVTDIDALRYRVATHRIGDSVAFEIVRRGQTRKVNFHVEVPPEIPPRNATELSGGHPLEGATVGNLSPALADELGLDLAARGVAVLQVRRGCAAQRFGFRPGDIVSDINGAPIADLAQLQRTLAQTPRRWRFTVVRGGQKLSLQIGR
jgi:serine protease Do